MSKPEQEPLISAYKYEPLDPATLDTKKPVEARVVLLVITVLIAALVIAYSFIARSITIETNTVDPEISIKGGLKFRLGDNYLITRGTHSINIIQPGYYPLNEELRVTEKNNQIFKYDLVRLPDKYKITSLPEAGISIFIDDDEQGLTPLDSVEISEGAHKLVARNPYFFDYKETLNVVGGGNEIEHAITLTPAWANIILNTEPAGATLSLAEEVLGTTPLNTRIIQGQRAIRIKLDGYKSINRVLNVIAGEDQDLGTLILEKADGLINVVTTPGNANISVNGTYRGVSPLELKLEPENDYRIDAFKSGFDKQTRNVSVVSGKEQTLNITLQESRGKLSFRITPADATLTINGKTIDQNDRELNLPTEPQKITVSKAGYASINKTVTPKTGFPQEVVIELLTEAEAVAALASTAAINANGSRMIRIAGGNITMGAQRREPGRRTNEVIKKTIVKKPFLISRTEITNQQFEKFNKAHNSGRVGNKSLSSNNLPVVRVSWNDAISYCNWLSNEEGLTPVYDISGGSYNGADLSANGYRLPTEAEWAITARNDNGDTRKFTWGDTYPPPLKSGNFADESAGSLVRDRLNGYRDGHIATAPVASFNATRAGVHDLAGNVSEWVHDYYSVAGYSDENSAVDPSGPESGNSHVIRGSSWRHGTIVELRASYRDNGNSGRDDLGFRIARNAP